MTATHRTVLNECCVCGKPLEEVAVAHNFKEWADDTLRICLDCSLRLGKVVLAHEIGILHNGNPFDNTRRRLIGDSKKEILENAAEEDEMAGEEAI